MRPLFLSAPRMLCTFVLGIIDLCLESRGPEGESIALADFVPWLSAVQAILRWPWDFS